MGSVNIPVNEAEFCVIDTETTDLDASRGRVIEVAAVTMLPDGSVVDVFSSLINPGPGVDPGRTDIHRIDRAMLDDAPSFLEVAGELISRLAGRVVVAHNAPFDTGHLAAEFARNGLVWPDVVPMCTAKGSRKYLPGLPNHRLGTVADHLGVTLDGWHAAQADTVACAGILAHLLRVADVSVVPVTPVQEWPAVFTPGRVLARA